MCDSRWCWCCWSPPWSLLKIIYRLVWHVSYRIYEMYKISRTRMCELCGDRWGFNGWKSVKDGTPQRTTTRRRLTMWRKAGKRAFSNCEEVMKNYGRRDKKEKPNPSGPVSFMDNVSSIFVGTVGLFYYRHRKRLSQKCASSLDGCIRLRAGFGFGSKYLSIANFIVLNRCEGSISSSFC